METKAFGVRYLVGGVRSCITTFSASCRHAVRLKM
jgi:hypothetical protein